MATNKIVASAPAKVILFGEHAVVHGALAIAASIDCRTTVSVVENNERNLRLIFKNLDLDVTLPISNATVPSSLGIKKEQAIECCLRILENLKPLLLGITVTISSDFPLGAGLGSSASLSVSLSAALLANEAIQNGESAPRTSSGGLTDEFLNKVNSLADNCERLFHGNPSGVDTATCVLGGIVKFQKSEGVQKIAEQLVMKIAVVNSKVERQTSKTVENVRNLIDLLPKPSNSIINSIKDVAEVAAHEIHSSESSVFKILNLVRMNHGLLYALGVSHPVLEQINLSVSSLNVGFKLTGAGAGGNALIFIPPDVPEKDVVDKLLMNGFEAKIVKVGVRGVDVDVIEGGGQEENYIAPSTNLPNHPVISSRYNII